MYLPILYHPGLEVHKYKDLFNKCRKENISFDIERKTGTLVLLLDEIKSGIVSLITISNKLIIILQEIIKENQSN